MQPPFILASASPRRLEPLRSVGLEPQQIIPAEIDETPRSGELPRDYVRRMAEEKCETVRRQHPQATVLAADTIVVCGRSILGKPEDAAQAQRFLQRLSGRRHRVYTAVCVSGRCKVVMTQIRFKRLTAKEISAYVACGEWQGKAGGYAIQGRAAAFIPFLSGSHSNVVGLPLAETVGLLSMQSVAVIEC